MSNAGLVSIIVPIYKVERYLDECITSLVYQTYRKLEIILVDDGSPDNCPQICDAWEKADDRIKVIHMRNGGVSSARNAGIHASAGEWLLFVDADDVVPNRFVEALVKYASNGGNLAVSRIERFKETIPSVQASGACLKCGDKALAQYRGGLFCCGALYSRMVVRSIQLQFDELIRNLEDVVWNGIYLRYVTEVIYVDVPYFYRITPESITSKCNDYRWQISSWIAARRSIMNWFSDKELTVNQKSEVARMYRHCQNNIYAECIAGSIPCVELRNLEKKEEMQFCEALIFAPERFLRSFLPNAYFLLYTFIIKVKALLV